MKLYLSPEPRFKLERLCDHKHPHEVGGFLLGQKTDEGYLVVDVFPVPNVSKKPESEFSMHPSGSQWAELYAGMLRLGSIGRFHSHPNGSIPSEADMSACPYLSLWVMHHGPGRHTFASADHYTHLGTELLNASDGMYPPTLSDGGLRLGEIAIAPDGRVLGHELSVKILGLPVKSRRALIACLRLMDEWRYVDGRRLSEEMGVMYPTVREWLKPCVEAQLIKNVRGRIRVLNSL